MPDLRDQRVARITAQWIHLAQIHRYGGEWTPTEADIAHSGLLERLLDNRDPLPLPPPLAWSYPWYSIVEKGVSYFTSTRPDWFTSDNFPNHVVICQHPGWEVKRHLDPAGWVLTHPGAPGDWELRPLTEDEEHPVVGHGVPPHPDVLADWCLRRVSTNG